MTQPIWKKSPTRLTKIWTFFWWKKKPWHQTHIIIFYLRYMCLLSHHVFDDSRISFLTFCAVNLLSYKSLSIKCRNLVIKLKLYKWSTEMHGLFWPFRVKTAVYHRFDLILYWIHSTCRSHIGSNKSSPLGFFFWK